ncbi:MAG: glycosyltransferase family 2 protein [Lachnospiraceae bacterium]|nr:glycosyltransferase family 2 protein [Lachnospiraceae bacterium]
MFSVIIPAYNCENTIQQALDSVRRQTRFDLVEEIIVLNDGSTDCTGRAMVNYISRHPSMPILYLRHKNHGVSYTRNRGIQAAKAERIALLDGDDVWLEQKLERQAQILAEHPDICFLGSNFPLKILLKRRHGLCKMTAADLCLRSCTPTPSVIFKKSAGEALGLFDESRQFGEDAQFYQRFLLYDSYYILAEKLDQISIQKKYHGESGLSSHIKKCSSGRDHNIIELCRMGLIRRPFMAAMLVFSQIKFLRRWIIWSAHRCSARLHL